MDSGVIAFFILSIVGGLIALIVVSVKRANREEEPVYEVSPRSTMPERTYKPVRSAAPTTENSGQFTVYAYRGSGRKCLCAFCDGENSMTATQCCICGQPLR